MAKKTGTILEINAHPARLDLKDVNIRKAKEAGVGVAISTDTHILSQLDTMRFGVSVARRGWLEKSDTLNAYSYKELKKNHPKKNRLVQSAIYRQRR